MASAWGNFVLDKGFDVVAQITKYRFVKLTADQQVGPIAAKTDDVIGVPQFDVLTSDITRGKGASVRVIGVSEVEAAGAIAVGARVELVADGTVATSGSISGSRIVGICVGSPSANAGDRVSVLILHGLGTS